MGIVTGYLTIPNIGMEEFSLRVCRLKKLGLKTRLFDHGVCDERLIGPNGVLFSGKANLKSPNIREMMYDRGNVNGVSGLTYDVSYSNEGESFDVGKLPVSDFESYFVLRVKINGNMNKILDFNKHYLYPRDGKGVRLSEQGYVSYEHLTRRENLCEKIKTAKESLESEGFIVDEKKTTILGKLL